MIFRLQLHVLSTRFAAKCSSELLVTEKSPNPDLNRYKANMILYYRLSYWLLFSVGLRVRTDLANAPLTKRLRARGGFLAAHSAAVYVSIIEVRPCYARAALECIVRRRARQI